MNITYQKGWQIEKANAVAELYEEAFGAKFCGGIPNKKKRIEVIAKGFVPEYSFAAIVDSDIVGLAGFQDLTGSLTGGIGTTQLFESLGIIRGSWACLVFSLFERKPKQRELVMDGIVVDSKCRGQGIGSVLLDKIIGYAKENHFDSVRLDVIDSNPRAKKLYESKGFVATKTESFPYLKWLIGFSGSTTMVLKVERSGL